MTAAFDPTTAKPVAAGGFDPASARPVSGGFDPSSAKPVGTPSALGQVGNAARTVATGVGNALDAQRYYAARALTGKDNTDDQRTAERQAVGTQGIYDALGRVPGVGHFLQGTSDVVQDTLTDPLTYETLGAGPVLKALGLADKAAVAATRVGKAVTDTPGGALLHDTMNWGGEVTRTHGKSTTNTIRGALNKASTTGAQTTEEYKRLSQGIIDGLSDDEKMNVRRGLNGEADHATLAPKEQQAATALRALTERDYADRTKTMLAKKYNELAGRLSPENRTALATALRTSTRPADGQLADVYDSLLHNVQQAMPHRENYAPTVHQAPDVGAQGRKAQEHTAGEHFDTRNLQREEVPTTEPGQLMEGFNALAGNAGKMASDRVVQESLGDLVNDPAVHKLITDTGKATGNERTNVQKVGDAWLKVIGYPRAATVSLTPRHAANILDLAANTVPPAQFPGYMKNVTALAAKLVRATPEETVDLLKDGRDLGAISQDFAEHKPFFQNVPGLNKWTAANNKLVWAVDNAAKQEYAKIIKAAHPEMSDLEAGGQASERLVDYAHTSPAVKALRYVAPFGTFRGSVPGAVLGGIARNPARAALLNRASGGTLYGGKPAKGQHGPTFYGPTSDVARGIDQPGEFLRATLGAPIQGAATLGAEALTGNPGASVQTIGQELGDLPGRIMRGEFSKIATPGKVSPYARSVALRTARFLNYGNPIDLRWLFDQAAAGLPEAQAAVEQLGASQFQAPKGDIPQRLGTEALRQSTGIGLR